MRTADGFAPIERIDGYLPIADHGLIGDGATAALVGRDGAISWLCVPRFDSPPLFCGLLDHARGGHFTVAPDELVAARQRYLGDTGVLVTEMRAESGLVQVTDGLALRAGADLSEGTAADRRELVRAVRVVDGAVRLRIVVSPRGGTELERQRGGLRLRCPTHPDLDLQLDATRPLNGLETTLDLEQGDEVHLSLRWGAGLHRYLDLNGAALLAETAQVWRRWSSRIAYGGPRADLVRRSAITLKLLDHFANGGIVAAPTSSLPEAIGGPRNWDYRYVWVRDAAFSVWALRRLGLSDEASGFLAWILDASECDGRPRVLYDVAGEQPPPEREDPELRGYRASRPVRWGNGAVDQQQHDVYGEIIDCAYLWGMNREIDPLLWERLCDLIERARREWDTPDQGIWEVRSSGRLFTYSVALCQVALDRGARLARRHGLPGASGEWAAAAAKLRDTILRDAWDPDTNSLTEHLGGGGLDASLLALPLRRVIPADHPRMVATVEAVVRRLGCGDGLLYRYLPEESPDGLAGEEGAFLLCSFWLVDNLAKQGRREEAESLFAGLCARANPLGLLPEQIDPSSGAFLGNYPQAFSHIGLISSAVNLAQPAG